MSSKTKQEYFIHEVTGVINRASIENGSNTPDFILAQYLWDCLCAFNNATVDRDRWWEERNHECPDAKELVGEGEK